LLCQLAEPDDILDSQINSTATVNQFSVPVCKCNSSLGKSSFTNTKSNSATLKSTNTLQKPIVPCSTSLNSVKSSNTSSLAKPASLSNQKDSCQTVNNTNANPTGNTSTRQFRFRESQNPVSQPVKPTLRATGPNNSTTKPPVVPTTSLHSNKGIYIFYS